MPDRTLITLALATPNIADVTCACAYIKRRPTSAWINYKTEPESADKKFAEFICTSSLILLSCCHGFI